MLNQKKILLAVTGSIAAYKIAVLIRLLVKQGAEVQVIMTKAATDFISPLTLATLSKNKVFTDLYQDDIWANHVMLGRWADVMIIAPASCNSIAKMANGFCDNLLTAVYLSATCPVMIAPAMDEDMWNHPSCKKNIALLESYGNMIIPVSNGELASGLYGDGRMEEPEKIMEHLHHFFLNKSDLRGKNILITAGPTQEALDPVRYLTNRSTGKMGIALAVECQKRGAQVNLILGPVKEKLPLGVNTIHVISAAQMFDECLHYFADTDIAIMCAAVADYTPVEPATQKIKKSSDSFSFVCKKTKDILKKLGEIKRENQVLAGFALETENEEQNALKKLREKKADFIILNSLRDEGAGFGSNTNKIVIFDKHNRSFSFDTKLKELVAADIINTITKK